MLQSVWSHVRRRRSLLPARDLFDADLGRARRKPGCALCRLVQEYDQQTMRSFLWEIERHCLFSSKQTRNRQRRDSYFLSQVSAVSYKAPLMMHVPYVPP